MTCANDGCPAVSFVQEGDVVQRYRALLEGGPRHGRKGVLRAGPLGGPPDFIYPDEEGVYALAGAADRHGRLLYWWMPWARAAALRHIGPQTNAAPRAHPSKG